MIPAEERAYYGLMFLAITFGIALVLAFIVQTYRDGPFSWAGFLRRLLPAWVIVAAASPLLFLGWCILKLAGVHGCVNC